MKNTNKWLISCYLSTALTMAILKCTDSPGTNTPGEVSEFQRAEVTPAQEAACDKCPDGYCCCIVIIP